MDPAVAHQLVSDRGAQALAAAGTETDPDSLAAASRLRRSFPAELAAAALDQVALRRRAVDKIGPAAADMVWTRDGLEQATRGAVSRWRASRLVAAGVRRVIDLGCACGADARACLEAGIEIVAVEIDPGLAVLAGHNLPGARVIEADAEAIGADLVAQAGPGTAVMIDPARRTGRGRSWRIEDIRPSWEFVLGMLDAARAFSTVVKLGPGVPRELLPDGAAITWLGHRRDLVEATLWAGPAADLLPGHQLAVRVGDTPAEAISLPGGEGDLEVGPIREFLAEPHPAVIRARAMRAAAGGTEVRVPAPGVGYLLADEPAQTPWLTWFRVLDSLPVQVRALRSWVRGNRIGTLEIKKRGIDIDPAALRRSLHPRGPHQAVLVLTPTTQGARALVVERLRPGTGPEPSIRP